MNKVKAAAIFTCLAASLPGHASAEEHPWKRQFIGEYVSEQNEALPDFLRRTGVVLHDFTVDTGFEACGAIASADGRYSVRLYSDSVPQGCSVKPSEVADGAAFTGETIHSHPYKKLLVLNASAKAWSEFYRDGNANAPTLRNDGTHGFSKADRKNGGWLIASRQLMHLEDGKTVNYGSVPTGK